MYKRQLHNNNHDFAGDDFRRTCYLLKKGYKVGYCDSLHAYTQVPTSLKDFVEQRIRWQKGYFNVFFENLEFIKRNDRLGATWKYSFVMDFLLHPFKLLSLPFLVLFPEIGLALYLSYTTIEAYSVYKTEKKGEKKRHLSAILLSPIYDLGIIVGPRTIGWIKALVSRD